MTLAHGGQVDHSDGGGHAVVTPGAAGSPARRRARARRVPRVVAAAAGLCFLTLPAAPGCLRLSRTDSGSPIDRLIDAGAAAAPTGASRQPAAEPDPLAEAWRDEASWPARWGRASDEPPGRWGVVVSVQGPVMAWRRGEETVRKLERELAEDVETLVRERARWRSRVGVPVTGEGPGAFAFVRTDPPRDKAGRSPNEPAAYLKFISGRRAVGTWREPVRIERTWLAYYEPVAQASGTPAASGPGFRGVAVVLPGLFGTPWGVVDQTVAHLRAQGWAVLRMLAHPSRFTETGTIAIAGDEDIEPMGRRLAAVLQDRAAECAYAVEESLAFLERARPELAGLPRVAVGMSGGAMVLPTVVARAPDAYAGAVLIAGGGDFLSVLLDSNYSDWVDALSVRWPPEHADETPARRRERADEQRRRLVAAYFAAAPIDPLRTIRALDGKPVLFVHASADLAVPAALGEAMWERAGRPQRWTYDTGHEGLFFMLPWELPRIAAWIDQRVAPRGPEAGAAGVGPGVARAPG